MQKGTKNRFMAALIATVISISVMAQAPQKMSFQSIIRNSSGALVINQPVGLRISVLQGSATGVAVYSETQTDSTNANGLVSLQIGGGKVVTGSFTAINWATGTYFIKTDIDPTGGNNYTVSGTSQLLSVAYALYAQNAGIPGVKGDSGVSVRSSKVIGDSLFVTLSTGQTINTGNVRGTQGVQGVQGLVGSTGLTGAQGIQGLTGATGTQGIQGLTGNTGAQGQQGLTGNKGDSGISVRSSKVIGDSLFVILSTGQLINTGNVRGAQGVQGIQGLIGSTGLTGAQGIQGLTGAQGLQGIQGVKGDAGVQGLQGIQGVTGNTGAKGDSGVSVRSSKVFGDSLFVTLSTGQVINTGNVRGAQGVQGVQGLTGSTGLTGAQGIQGLTGAQGLQGIQGVKGDAGVQGLQGIQGVTGNTGAKGDSGVSVRSSKVFGDSLFVTLSTGQVINTGNVRGAQGVQGIQGLIGSTGLTGTQGIQGLTGATGAQGIQGLTGNTGAQGQQGLTGNKGDSGVSVRSSKVVGDSLFVTLSTGQVINTGNVRGAQGAQGVQGVQGVQGLIGSAGLTGAQGIQGLTGATGAQGIQGLKGDKGDTGIQGLTGIQGIQGLTGVTGAQGIQGLMGDSGVGVRTTNVSGDSLYISLSTGKTIVAGNVRGATGVQGVQGIQGVQGQQGIQGLTGAKGDSGVSIRTTKVNGDSLYITLSNGQTLNAGNVRGLTGATGATGGYLIHTIGESYGGGIVFFVYDGGQHGLIAATADYPSQYSTSINSGNASYVSYKGDGLLAGYKNTISFSNNYTPLNSNTGMEAIMKDASNGYTAIFNGVSLGDWYVPSKYELNLMYLNKSIIGGFTSTYPYPSSSTNGTAVWFQNFINGSQLNQAGTNGNVTFFIRLIRAF